MKNILRFLRKKIVSPKMKLHTYKDPSGNFDYVTYKKIQEEGNKRKIDRSWITSEDIDFLSDYILSSLHQKPSFGICHGTRQGLEQKWFSEKLGCEVIGTEISETAKEFPQTVQWDFHEENPDWENKADFIYSNSFDHSYDPEKALCAWMKTLKQDGLCIIEHTQFHTADAVSALDPFGADLDIMPYLVLRWSKNTFSVREILQSPHKREYVDSATFLIIKKN